MNARQGLHQLSSLPSRGCTVLNFDRCLTGVFYYASQKAHLVLCRLHREHIGPAVCCLLFPRLFDFAMRCRAPMIVLLPSGLIAAFQDVTSSRSVSSPQIQSRSLTCQGFEIPSHLRSQSSILHPHSSAHNGWILHHYPGSSASIECGMSPTLGHHLETTLWKQRNLCDGKHGCWRRSRGRGPLIGGYSLTLPPILFSTSCIVSSPLITVNLTMPLTLWWNNPLELWTKITFLLLRGTCNGNVKP